MSGSKIQREIRQSRPFVSDAQEAALALVRTSDLLKRRLAETIEPNDLTVQQYNVLRILRGAHPDAVPTLEIATRMIEQAPGITRLLDRLEAKRLIERVRCQRDRRRVLCTIATPGLDLLAALDAPVLEALRASFAELQTDQIRELIQLLDDVREGIYRTFQPQPLNPQEATTP